MGHFCTEAGHAAHSVQIVVQPCHSGYSHSRTITIAAVRLRIICSQPMAEHTAISSIGKGFPKSNSQRSKIGQMPPRSKYPCASSQII